MNTNYTMTVVTNEFVYTYHYKSWEEAQQYFAAYVKFLDKTTTADVNAITVTNDEHIRLSWERK